MSFMDEMKNVFSKKTPEQIYVESVLKEIRQRDDLIKTVSQMSSQLDHCQRAFDNAIRISRINALRRRQAHLSDAGEKERIRDAVVGQLAVQEAKFDVNSIVTAQDMEIAMKKLGGILRQMYRMDHNVSVTIQCSLNDLRELFDVLVGPVMGAVAVSALHHHIIRLIRILRVLDQRLILVSDIAGEHDGFRRSRSRWTRSRADGRHQ